MTSIHRNQPEKHRQDLHGQDAIDKIKEIIGKSQNCFFCTAPAGAAPGAAFDSARPMNVRQVDDGGHLWFLSAGDSSQNQELARDPKVRLYFQGSPHADFLQLHGLGTISSDRGKIRELWEPVLQTWFTAGVDDPRITVIQVAPTEGYYWDTKHGGLVAGIKMWLGAALGKTLDDSVEGALRV
jgi:general stress protein 26